MRNNLVISLLAVVSSALIACGNDAGNDQRRDNETFIRIFNAVYDIPGVDVTVDDDLYFSNVGFLESSGYFRIRTTDTDLQVTATNSFTPLYSRGGGLDDLSDNSLFVYGKAEDERSVVLKDENQSPGTNLSKVRIVNLSSANRRGLDVYVVASDTSRLPAAPTAEGLGAGGVAKYVVSSSGQYDIVVTSADSSSPISELSRQNLDSKGVYTVVIADSVGGRLPLRIVLLRDSRDD